MCAEFDADIVIVGAGISGLSAALAIYDRVPTLSILILEGNGRIGGRTAPTSRLNVDRNGQDVVFDLGGQFVSSYQSHLMTLLAKLEIPLVETVRNGGKTIGAFDDGVYVSGDPPLFGLPEETRELELFLGDLEILADLVSLENPLGLRDAAKYDGVTMEEYIDAKMTSSFCRKFMHSVVRISCGIKSSDISVLFYLSYCNSTEGVTMSYLRSKGGAKQFWIQGGASKICERIVEKIGVESVKVDCIISAITRDNDKVILNTTQETYSSRYVIIAVPPRKLLEITFNPPLNEARMEVLQNMCCSPIVKFVVTYEKAFWKPHYNGDIFGCESDVGSNPIIWCVNISLEGSTALTGLLNCSATVKESHKTEVLRQLAAHFGNDALDPIDYAEKLWSDECNPFEGCLTSYPRPSNMYSFHEIRRPIGRLFFAGAETATYWYGYMAGAAQAGYRAAVEVLYDIRPQVLTVLDFAELKPPRQPVRMYDASVNICRDWIVLLFVVGVVVYLASKIGRQSYGILQRLF